MSESSPIETMGRPFRRDFQMPESGDYPVTSYGPRVPEFQKTLEIRNPRAGEGTGGGSSGGAFCTLYQDEALDWWVTGGPVRVCDTKTFEVPPWSVDVTGSPVDRLLYVEVNVEVNRTDDGDYFLSGIKTSSDLSLAMDDDTSVASYPVGTAPVLSTGLGVIILAVGLLKVVDGVPKFYPAGCGAFILEHCNGNLTHRAR